MFLGTEAQSTSFSELWKKHGGEVIDPKYSPETPDKLDKVRIPEIIISKTKVEGEKYIIEGYFKYPDEINQLTINGNLKKLSQNGRFAYFGYIPPTGITLTIVGYANSGIQLSKRIQLTRTKKPNVSDKKFAQLDPLRGKKAVRNNNAVALIIGVADYQRTVASALYADKDAEYFRDYSSIKLGVPDNNIFTLINRDADRVEIQKAVKKWLVRTSEKDKTDVYVFFAGHGLASSDGTNNMFLLPYDGDPELLEDSAIDRKQLFADIQAISPRSVTVFLDSCYSGGTRAGGTLVASLRPIAIRAKEQNVPDGFTILSAAKGDQTSQSLEEAKHGLFSYFLMKGLEGDADANNDNQITASELHSFVTDKVERQSGFKQTPDLQGDADRVLVRFQ